MDDKNTQVLNTEEEFVDSYEDNESMSTLLNSVKAGGETLQTFTDKKLSETVKYTGTKPVYPVAAEVDDWECDGWIKTGTTEPVYALDANIPLYQDTSGTNTFIAHYKDVSDFLRKKSYFYSVGMKYGFKIQDDEIENATNICLNNFISFKDTTVISQSPTLITNTIIMRNYCGWNLDNDPVAEGKTQEEEEGIPNGGFIIAPHLSQIITQNNYAVTHLEVDIPNFKGRIHAPNPALVSGTGQKKAMCSAGLWINHTDGTSTRTGTEAYIQNYAGQTLDCLSWKEGQQGDQGNLMVDPQCKKLIAYMPDLYGCITNGPEEIYYYKLKRDKKITPAHVQEGTFWTQRFPTTCKLWDAGHLNEITDHYKLPTNMSSLATLILHYGDGDPDYPGETGIVPYNVNDEECDIPSTCKVYVPSSLVTAYQADANWSATGVEFLAIENCKGIEGHPEDDWIRKDMEACLWRFEAYNKLETKKEKRLFLKSCAGKSNDYDIPNEYKYDYPDWYWDIDDIDEGETTYGGINTSSRTKNVTSYYTHKYMTNTLTDTLLEEFLQKITLLGTRTFYKSHMKPTEYWYNKTSFTIPQNINQIYPGVIPCDLMPSLKDIYINSDILNITYYHSGQQTFSAPFQITKQYNRRLNLHFKSLEQFQSINFAQLYNRDKSYYNPEEIGEGGIYLYINNNPITEINLKYNDYLHFVRNVTKITIDNSITTLNSFYGCRELNNVILNNNITSIPTYCFAHTGLQTITLSNKINSVDTYSFYKSNLMSIDFSSITETVSIGESAFDTCTQLSSIILPTSINSLPKNMCLNCTSLSSISIPSSVTAINQSCFSGCTGLTDVYINSNGITLSASSFYIDLQHDLNMHFSSEEVFYNTIIPTEIFRLDDTEENNIYPYINDTKLEDISFPDNITTIPKRLFGQMTINSIANWNNVTELGPRCFYGTRIIEDVIIPDGVTGSTLTPNFEKTKSLKRIAFAEPRTICKAGGSYQIPKFYIYNRQNADDIKVLEFPATIETIESYFATIYFTSGKLGGVHIKCKAIVPPTCYNNTFTVVTQKGCNFKILVPQDSVDAYKSAKGWSKWSSYIEGYTEED